MFRFRDAARRVRKSSLAHNTIALYGVHIASLLVPLITIPYLARVLRPEGWGLVVFAQSFAAWLMLVLEYGFTLSATRLVARARDDEEQLATVVADVMGAKVILLLVLLASGALAAMTVPIFRRNPEILIWAWLFAVAQGLSPSWYFQGIERMGGAALLEMSAKVAAMIGIFIWVREMDDGWIVLALQAITGLAWIAVATSWMYRDIPVRRASARASLAMLRAARGLFIFRAGSGVYTQANSFILGLISTPLAVAYFGGAEKIVRAATGLVQPASQALYPRISQLVVTDPLRARKLVRLSLVGVGGLGLALGIAILVGAPFLVDLLLGPGYESAVPVLRMLALLPPIIALGTVLGIQWALPLGLDRPFYVLVLSAGALNLLLAAVLAPEYGAFGMAVSVVLAEALVAFGLLRVTWSATGALWVRAQSGSPQIPIIAGKE
ncbi:MAG TPA: oligosaccharide flippase family protein [Longimicrobiaceae bacterium]|nr:oligosaccharide flippase family protein [Longimicrobiaceae bacterium]